LISLHRVPGLTFPERLLSVQTRYGLGKADGADYDEQPLVGILTNVACPGSGGAPP
jgi:hypothetical protein